MSVPQIPIPDIKKIAEEAAKEVLYRVLTPDEIRRLKVYARDEYYYFYIPKREELDKTIERAKSALDLANKATKKALDAIGIANTAHDLAEKAKSVADQAWSAAQNAWSRATELAGRVKDLASKVTDLDGMVSDLKQKALNLMNWYDTFKAKIAELRDILTTKQKELNEVVAEVNDLVTNRIPAKLNEIAREITNLVGGFGYAKMKQENFGGVQIAVAVKGQGILFRLAKVYEHINKFYVHMSKIVEEKELKFCLFDQCVDLGKLPVVNPTFVLKAVQDARNVAYWARHLAIAIDYTGRRTRDLLKKTMDLTNLESRLITLVGKAGSILNEMVMAVAIKLGEALGVSAPTTTPEATTVVTYNVRVPSVAPTVTYDTAWISKLTIPVTLHSKTVLTRDGRIQALENLEQKIKLDVLKGTITPL